MEFLIFTTDGGFSVKIYHLVSYSMKNLSSLSILERNELETKMLRYLMRRAQILFEKPEFSENPSQILLVREILQEEYSNRPRLFSRSRQMRTCPLTGRTRGY